MKTALFSILLGFSTLLSQVVILREVFSQCGGNEVVYGMGLGLWLLSGGAGALSFREGVRPSWKLIEALAFAIPLLALLGVLFTRGARVIVGILPGEAPPFHLVLLVTSAPLFLPSLAGGMLFRQLSLTDDLRAGKSSVFFYEAIGASIAGVLSLIPYCIKEGPYFFLSICLLTSAAAIILVRRLLNGGEFSLVFPFLMLLASLALLLCSGYFDSLTAAWSFRGFEHTHYRQTLTGRFDVTTDGEQKTFYTNLKREFVSGDPVFSEEMVHFPASFGATPRRFLLIGASLLPLVRECEKYGDVSVSVVDADFLHAESVIAQIDGKGLEEVYVPEDPVRFFSRGGKEYDVVIQAPGLPVTLASLRTLRASFYRNVSGALAKTGIMFVRLPFGGDYIGDDFVHILDFLHAAMFRSFGAIRIIPGGEFSFIASHSLPVGEAGSGDVANRLRSRQLKNVYFLPEIVPFRMDGKREAWARSLLSGRGSGGIFDQLPVIYGLSSVFSQHADIADRAIVRVFKVAPPMILLSFLIFYALFFFGTMALLGRGLSQAILFFSGALGILVEVTLIFAFQMAFGSVYTHIGLLFCSYMAGLAAGSSGVLGSVKRASFAMLGGTALSVMLVLWVFGGQNGLPPSPLFYFALFVTGSGGGGLFAGSGHRLGSYSRSYALDLAGSALAAFTGASFLIPLCGVVAGALVIGALSVFVVVMSFLVSPRG